MIALELLDLLRCPETMQPLRAAAPDLLERLNRARPDERLDEALLREDGAVMYPIRDGIPVLLPEAAIPISTLDQLRPS